MWRTERKRGAGRLRLEYVHRHAEMDPRADALVRRLRLVPHPEGGFYREIYRSSGSVRPGDDRPARAAVTSIYFLLAAGQHSRWHRVRSDEIWHFYEGEPIDLLAAPPALDRVERVTLGPLSGGGQPVGAVPAGWWQAARPQGAYGLVGCTVAPGFDFADFTQLRDDPRASATLRTLHAGLAGLL